MICEHMNDMLRDMLLLGSDRKFDHSGYPGE